MILKMNTSKAFIPYLLHSGYAYRMLATLVKIPSFPMLSIEKQLTRAFMEIYLKNQDSSRSRLESLIDPSQFPGASKEPLRFLTDPQPLVQYVFNRFVYLRDVRFAAIVLTGVEGL